MTTRWFASLLALSLIAAVPAAYTQESSDDPAVQRALRHAEPEWQAIAGHLPDPKTATPDALIMAADVLRARRLPEDALDFYQAALARGGDEAKLRNDIGVTLLELHRYDEARGAFRRAVQLSPKVAQDWNNLGAAEYVGGNYRVALADYLHAVKLNKKVAVYHSNLGTAYFELKDYESARDQFLRAMKLDPDIFHSGGWAGVQAHVLSASDHGRFCFEMAKMSARQHDDENVIRWLGRSVETGFDIKGQMLSDKDFAPYLKDARIAILIHNAHAMRGGQIADSGLAPPIPDKVQ